MNVLETYGNYRIIQNSITGKYRIQGRYWWTFFIWENTRLGFPPTVRTFDERQECEKILLSWMKDSFEDKGWSK